ncbi:MAG: hypothetical protein AABX32_01980 [Nanoarchaeota archaeon]
MISRLELADAIERAHLSTDSWLQRRLDDRSIEPESMVIPLEVIAKQSDKTVNIEVSVGAEAVNTRQREFISEYSNQLVFALLGYSLKTNYDWVRLTVRQKGPSSFGTVFRQNYKISYNIRDSNTDFPGIDNPVSSTNLGPATKGFHHHGAN